MQTVLNWLELASIMSICFVFYIAKAWMEGSRIQQGYPGPQELFIQQQRDSDMKKVEIREREEKRQERERQYTKKLRNGNLDERERERVYQHFEGNWI